MFTISICRNISNVRLLNYLLRKKINLIVRRKALQEKKTVLDFKKLKENHTDSPHIMDPPPPHPRPPRTGI